MSIITISRGSYSRGKEIAEKLARRLGYECIARETLLEASEQFNIPEIRLLQAIRDAPSILDSFVYGKERYIAYIQVALLRRVRKDNVVYHGLAGHFLIRGIAHVLKVRIVADLESRASTVMERDHCTRKEALRFLKGIDEERRKWSKRLYGIDTADPSLYDLVLNIKSLTADDAAEIICDTVRLERFQTTPESQKAIDDLYLASEVKAALFDVKPDIDVSADGGVVVVKTKAQVSKAEELVEEMTRIARRIPGVRQVRVDVAPQFPERDLY